MCVVHSDQVLEEFSSAPRDTTVAPRILIGEVG